MHITEEEKKLLERQFVEAIIAGLEKDKLEIHDLHILAEAILDRIDHIKTQEDLLVLLTDLNNKWPVFDHLISNVHNHARQAN